MTQLVISVRSAAEAMVAANNGADIVDVKEPQRGSMGAADPTVLAAVRAAVPNATLSFAAGELIENSVPINADRRTEVCGDSTPAGIGYSFAKAAPAGCRSPVDWRRAWARWTASLAAGIKQVAVVYADAESAAAPDPERLLPLAIECGSDGILFDTHNKRGIGLFDIVSTAWLSKWVVRSHASGVWVCLAGSLKQSDIARVADCGSDLVAFRTAACRGGRLGAIDAEAVSGLAESLSVCS